MESTPEGGTSLSILLLQASNGAISGSSVIILLIVIFVLLLLTAITAGAETAYFSLTAKDINYLKSKDKVNMRQTVKLLEKPKMLLATIVVANNAINIAIIITTNLLISEIIKPFANPLVLFLVQVIIVTFLLVLFGEVLPKVYATQNNLRMALFCAPTLKVLMSIFRPVSRILVNSTNFIERQLSNKLSRTISSEDFEHAIELTVGHSATKEEVSIFKGILKFGNITAKQIMRTRLDVSGLEYNMSFAEVQQHCIEVGYSRLPVYKETLDKIAGMIHTKDFLPYTDKTEFDWHKLIRPAYFVHENKFIEDLLKEFQQKRIHLAIVVDEFGGTSGIVTLEDIMEEVIGDIKDEFDEEDQNYRRIDDHNFIFEGKTPINDVCRVIGEPQDIFDKVRGESDSLAGLVLEIAGKFPAVNETLHFEQYDFTVLAIENRRIQRVKLTINEPMAKPEEV